METDEQKKTVLINAVMSVAQVVLLGAVLLVLYRFLLDQIGSEQLGIWAVVLSTTSMVRIGNLGLSGSVVKFVAKYATLGQDKEVSQVIQTAVVSLGIFVGVILIVAYPAAVYLLKLVISPVKIDLALEILPLSMVSLWTMVIVGVLQSGLDGHQCIARRCMIFITVSIVHLLLVFVFVPRFGLVGVAYAQVIQALLLAVCCWIAVRSLVRNLPIVPYRWDYKLFREMIRYGLNFQVISITQMLCDPITKMLLSKFGGLSMVGFYEMASRMLMQLRSLFVSANQVLVPAIAKLQEHNPDYIQKVYRYNYRMMFYISLPFYCLIAILSPLISELWIGGYEDVFVYSCVLLSFSLFFSSISAPAYFAYLGVGKLKWNMVGHLVIAGLNVVLGFAAGILFGGMAVVAAWVAASIFGTLVIILSYQRCYEIEFKELVPRESRAVLITCLAGIAGAAVVYYKMNTVLSVVMSGVIVLCLFLAVIAVPLWVHPVRRAVAGWVAVQMFGNSDLTNT